MNNKIEKSMYTYHVKEMIFVSTCRKIYIQIAVYFLLVLTALVLIIIPHIMTKDKVVYHQRTKYATDLKYVLFWSQPKRQQRGHFIVNKTPEFQTGQHVFINQKCLKINCYITYNKDILKHNKDFDAVIFDIDDVKRLDINLLNLTRTPEQIYIFRSSEPAEKHPLCNHEFENFFNWTWTYKLNSDLPQPFYTIFTKNDTIVGPKKGMKWVEKMNHNDLYTAKTRQKTKAVAWIVNKCKLKMKHQDFINELRNELKGYNYTVDIFGSCGQNRCSNAVKCQKIVEKNYFFQLVLEEHFSEDYVTDTIVNAMSHVIIPIVVGAGDYKNFLPPGSYVNAQAFDLKKLGAIVDYLIKNPDMYNFFFDWKNHYYYKKGQSSQICELCDKLNRRNKTIRSYKHFRYWWEPDYKDICQRIRLYKMFNPDM